MVLEERRAAKRVKIEEDEDEETTETEPTTGKTSRPQVIYYHVQLIIQVLSCKTQVISHYPHI